MTGWIAQNALAASVLILLVLLIRRPVANAFGARAAYALWLAPAVRAVMPPVSLPSLGLPQVAALSSPIDMTIVTEPASAAGLPWMDILAIAWALGTAGYLALHWIRHQRFLAAALADGCPLDEPAVPYDLIASDKVDGPLATGLVHPIILVPGDFETRFTAHQRRLVLLHEASHHRRGDIWACLGAMLLTAFLWFNPFAHMALRAFRRDMEAACDARVLADAGEHIASGYAETILRSVARPVPRSLCALTTVDELKGRLMMLNQNFGRGRKVLGLGLAGGLTAVGLALAGPAAAHDPAKPGEPHVRQIEIREYSGGKDVLIKRDGKGHADLAVSCPGEKVELGSEGASGTEKQQMKIVLCGAKGENMVAALEKAAAEIEKRDIPADRKADILSKMRAKIAELKNKG